MRNSLAKTIPSRPGYQSDDTAKPEVPTFNPNQPKAPFGRRGTANGMNNPTSFNNGMYRAMSDMADDMHPVKRRR